MSYSELDFQAIREKLQYQQQSSRAPQAATPPIEDWPSTPTSSPGADRASLSQINGAIAALQQRSSTRHHQPVSAHQPTPPQPTPHQLLHQLQLHKERLQHKAQEINALSTQQERAMVEMKDVIERWRREVQAYVASYPEAARTVEPLINEFLCDYESAVLAWADIEADGGIVLAYRSADYYQATREANQIAQSLRRQSLSSSPPASPLWSETGPFWVEAMEGLKTLWRQIKSYQSQWWPSISASSSRPTSSHLTLIDAVIWFGGGVFSRIALNFLLAIYPGLWSLAVAIVTAMTAYALYRATLAPRLNFGLAYRVLLVIGGLIIGGRFS